MAKRKETLELEAKLYKMCEKDRIYGCEEVTIGFHNNGHGNEIVDFCTMDSKGILRCYEIKVTLADLKSNAKKSWYGHYNYLVITNELYEKIKDNFDNYIPAYVGVMIPNSFSWSNGFEVVFKARKQTLSVEQEAMLKESIIRSMYYKMAKYRDAADMEKVKALQKEYRKADKERTQYQNENATLHFAFRRIERVLKKYYDKEVDLLYTVDEFEHRRLLLPENIALTLNDKGKQLNKNIEEDKLL